MYIAESGDRRIIAVALLLLLLCASLPGYAQKTMMVERVGTPRRFFLHAGDPVKVKAVQPDTLLRGRIWSVSDSFLTVQQMRPYDIKWDRITAVYRSFPFPKKFGKYMLIGGGMYFTLITANHLLNNERVFTPDMFILSGAFVTAGGISISLSQKKYRTGARWKIKILDGEIR